RFPAPDPVTAKATTRSPARDQHAPAPATPATGEHFTLARVGNKPNHQPVTTTPYKTMKPARAASATDHRPAPTLVTAKATARLPVRAPHAPIPTTLATGKRLAHARTSGDQGHDQITIQ
ncbi:hypothetical protein, partial [Craterilacuibacter sinensis]|uniref:hypothetical protein n=1 Tax=Craterilacuibacter sinensis TaxID=2686017 RepID=UPI001C800E15